MKPEINWDFYKEAGIKITKRQKEIISKFVEKIEKEDKINWEYSQVSIETEHQLEKLAENIKTGYPEMDEDLYWFKKYKYKPLTDFKEFEKFMKKHGKDMYFMKPIWTDEDMVKICIL